MTGIDSERITASLRGFMRVGRGERRAPSEPDGASALPSPLTPLRPRCTAPDRLRTSSTGSLDLLEHAPAVCLLAWGMWPAVEAGRLLAAMVARQPPHTLARARTASLPFAVITLTATADLHARPPADLHTRPASYTPYKATLAPGIAATPPRPRADASRGRHRLVPRSTSFRPPHPHPSTHAAPTGPTRRTRQPTLYALETRSAHPARAALGAPSHTPNSHRRPSRLPLWVSGPLDPLASSLAQPLPALSSTPHALPDHRSTYRSNTRTRGAAVRSRAHSS